MLYYFPPCILMEFHSIVLFLFFMPIITFSPKKHFLHFWIMFFISNFYYYVSMCPVSVAMDSRYEKLASPPVGGFPVSHAH